MKIKMCNFFVIKAFYFLPEPIIFVQNYDCLCSFFSILFRLYVSFLQADNAVAYHDLPRIDQHALFQLENVVKNIKESYENYQFFKIFQVNFLKMLFDFVY